LTKTCAYCVVNGATMMIVSPPKAGRRVARRWICDKCIKKRQDKGVVMKLVRAG